MRSPEPVFTPNESVYVFFSIFVLNCETCSPDLHVSLNRFTLKSYEDTFLH